MAFIPFSELEWGAEDEKKGPQKLSDLVPELRVFKMVSAWKECAGPALLKQTRFHGIQLQGDEQVLILEVPDPVWRGELEYQKSEILVRYCKKLRDKNFKDYELPTKILFSKHFSSMPFKAPYSKFRGHKP